MTRPLMPHGAWPRGLSDPLAAVYVGVSLNKYIAEVKAGLWPEPETRGRRKITDRCKIDEAWDRRDQDESGGDPLMEALNDCET